MVGLMASIVVFNYVALKIEKNLTRNQMLHIWLFTIAFQSIFDTMVEFKYQGYWYFGKEPDWIGILPHTILIPPVNVMFLNWFPFKKKKRKQLTYILIWVIAILIYEQLALIPEPWGYFHYGSWNLWYSVIADPILFFGLVFYFELVRWFERTSSG